MTWPVERIFPRRRGFFWIKTVAFTFIVWRLIVYGFEQNVNSDFGENLDRNQIEALKSANLDLEGSVFGNEQVSDDQEAKILNEFLEHLSKKSETAKKVTKKHRKDSKKSRATKPVTEELKEVEKEPEPVDEKAVEENVIKKPKNQEKTTEVTESEATETIWKFVKPTNIFGYENIGEMGKAVFMPSKMPDEILKLYNDGWKKHEFNQYLSDLISVNRSLPDYRTDYCKKAEANYSKDLPATSVIIIFHNEAWSTLLRSVHSVLNRSPEHLITEIILVDDCSTMEHLKQPLDDYMSNFPKVKIMRAPIRGGLIKARLLGTFMAKGPVLTFLDSHVECSPGWLEPLLDRIAIDPTNVPIPVISVLSATTFEFGDSSLFQVGVFDWKLSFKWQYLSEAEKKLRKDPYEPMPSPTMAGGLFSIDKAFFEKLGMYDPGFDIWGAENLEISFKTWMCGGKLEIIPCSRVGHVFRSKSPYTWREGVNVLKVNNMRLAEVWMDEYKEFYYTRTGAKRGDFGDISDRVELRKELNCKSFKWYLENVIPTLEIPGDSIAYGEFRNLGDGGRRCLDAATERQQEVIVFGCHGEGETQYWEYKDGLIQRDRFCVQIDGEKITSYLITKQSNQLWTYKNNTQQFYSKYANKCLTMNEHHKLAMEECKDSENGQKWQLQNLRPERLKEF